jgi:hypothetical protein
MSGRCLVLAERPFADLLSRALLGTLAAGAGAPPLLLATRAPRAPPGFEAVPLEADPVALGVTQVVLAGVFLDRARLEAALAIAARACAAGATLALQAFGVEGEAARREAPLGAAVLDHAAPIALRDHRSANVLTLWRVAAPLTIAAYPERHVAADAKLAALLPTGPILGLAIRGGAEMRRSWLPRVPALRRLLAPAAGWPVLPLPLEGPGSPGDDLAGSLDLAQAVLPGARILLPELADPLWWRRQVTPARLKALVARCALVATNRDLPAAYAVAAGVPVLGIALGADRRIISCLATLANELPPGSDLVHPRPG